ncbi:MAG TPA: tetratricopeptide repeat protein [Pirellulales bacterium]|jgi:tetratricopeptide (TPR) repeat protein
MANKSNKNRTTGSRDSGDSRSTAIPPTGISRERLLLAGAAVILAAGIALVYQRALNAPLIFDDETVIAKNPSLKQLWPLFGDSELRGPLNPPRDLSTSGRPLVNLSLAINYHFGEIETAGYHVVNMVLHLLATLLLLGIMRRTLRLDFFSPSIRTAADPLAFLVALAWTLHPLHTETVVYITQRTELMVGLFYLATLYASLRYWNATTDRSRRIWNLLAMLACALGMTCKEVMVTAPVAVLLFDRTFVAGSFRAALARSRWLYAGLAASWLVLLVLNIGGPRSSSAGFRTSLPAYSWWLTQTEVLILYLRLVCWPWPLTIHHQIPFLTTIGEAWPWLLTATLLAIATLALVARRTAAGFAIAWTFLILSPTLVVPIVTEVAAERRMYLPSASLLALVIVGGFALLEWIGKSEGTLADAGRGRRSLPVIAACALALAAAYGTVSVRRLAAYESAISIWQDAASCEPHDATVQTNWGVALAADGRPQEAIEHYEEALRIDPAAPEARPNLAEAYYDLGLRQLDQNKPAEAEKFFLTALGINADFANAHYALAGARAAQGDARGAAQNYAVAAKLRPDYVAAWINLGATRLGLGETESAASAFQQALRHSPDNADASFGLGIALAKLGKGREAAEQFQAAYRADPRRADAHFELANLLVAANNLPAAAEEYRAAIRVQPDYLEAWQNLGAVSLAQGNVKQAIATFQEVLRLQPDYPQARANLERAIELSRQQEGK